MVLVILASGLEVVWTELFCGMDLEEFFVPSQSIALLGSVPIASVVGSSSSGSISTSFVLKGWRTSTESSYSDSSSSLLVSIHSLFWSRNLAFLSLVSCMMSLFFALPTELSTSTSKFTGEVCFVILYGP